MGKKARDACITSEYRKREKKKDCCTKEEENWNRSVDGKRRKGFGRDILLCCYIYTHILILLCISLAYIDGLYIYIKWRKEREREKLSTGEAAAALRIRKHPCPFKRTTMRSAQSHLLYSSKKEEEEEEEVVVVVVEERRAAAMNDAACTTRAQEMKRIFTTEKRRGLKGGGMSSWIDNIFATKTLFFKNKKSSFIHLIPRF